MAKYVGVFQSDDGYWWYRIKLTHNGVKYDTRIKKDKYGQPFKTARQAYEAKCAYIAELKDKPVIEPQSAPEATLRDVYNNYLETEGKSKARATLRKQDSMWIHHIEPKFGDRVVDTITIVELNDFLYSAYQKYSYMYVEAFLKFFYLLFGHADRMEVIDQNRYNRMFVSSGTRLTMPKKTQEDHQSDLEGATVYNADELAKIEKVFNTDSGNLLTAFYLGLYCGLRISEVFAITWDKIDFKTQTILIDRQMQYDDGVIKLCPVKTLTSVRKVLIPTFLFNYLYTLYAVDSMIAEDMGKAYRNNESVYDEVSDTWITGGNFVNRKKNGELLTVNSIKYYAKKIKAETGIDFKFHNLRHTFATNCAFSNMNINLLMQFMGHKKIDTTRKYYINLNSEDFYARSLKVIDEMYEFVPTCDLTNKHF